MKFEYYVLILITIISLSIFRFIRMKNKIYMLSVEASKIKRRILNLSFEECASAIGYDPKQIIEFESGQRKSKRFYKAYIKFLDSKLKLMEVYI